VTACNRCSGHVRGTAGSVFDLDLRITSESRARRVPMAGSGHCWNLVYRTWLATAYYGKPRHLRSRRRAPTLAAAATALVIAAACRDSKPLESRRRAPVPSLRDDPGRDQSRCRVCRRPACPLSGSVLARRGIQHQRPGSPSGSRSSRSSTVVALVLLWDDRGSTSFVLTAIGPGIVIVGVLIGDASGLGGGTAALLHDQLDPTGGDLGGVRPVHLGSEPPLAGRASLPILSAL
jgi:hypothetical protein